MEEIRPRTVTHDAVVALSYSVYQEDGTILEDTDDESEKSYSYLHGRGFLLARMEKDLFGLGAGDVVDINLAPNSGAALFVQARVMAIRDGTSDELRAGHCTSAAGLPRLIEQSNRRWA